MYIKMDSLWTGLWSSGELGRRKSEVLVDVDDVWSTEERRISVVIISSLFRLPVDVIPVGDRSAADLFVLWLVLEALRSGEVMISSFAFQVRSLQRLVKLETELARRTACRAQVKQLRSEKLSPCSRGNRSDSNDCASITLPWPLSTNKVSRNAKDRHRIDSLTGFQGLFTKSTMRLALHFSVFWQSKTEQHTAHFPSIFPGVYSRARNWLTDNDLTDRW